MWQKPKVYDITGTRGYPRAMIDMTRGSTRKIIWVAVLLLAMIFGIPMIATMLKTASTEKPQPSLFAERILHRNQFIDTEFRKAMGKEEKGR